MSPLTRFFVRCVVFCVLIFIGAQAFNRFCFSSQKCSPIYFSRYIPRVEGTKEFDIKIAAISNRADFDFYTLDSQISTVVNRVNTVTFVAKNTSNKKIKFRLKLQVNPREFSAYIGKINCLCSEEYWLDVGEKINLKMEFFVKAGIEKDDDFKGSAEKLSEEILKIFYLVE